MEIEKKDRNYKAILLLYAGMPLTCNLSLHGLTHPGTNSFDNIPTAGTKLEGNFVVSKVPMKRIFFRKIIGKCVHMNA